MTDGMQDYNNCMLKITNGNLINKKPGRIFNS